MSRSLDCHTPNLHPHAMQMPRTTVADPEDALPLRVTLSLVLGSVGTGARIGQSMTTNHDNRRQVQRDAHLWAEYTGTNYTSALRVVGSPLAQGILGERITPQQLMQVLDTYPALGENGMNAASPYRNGDGLILGSNKLFLDVVLAAEVLQMFTPAAEPTIGSYSLKHTAEEFLD